MNLDLVSNSYQKENQVYSNRKSQRRPFGTGWKLPGQNSVNGDWIKNKIDSVATSALNREILLNGDIRGYATTVTVKNRAWDENSENLGYPIPLSPSPQPSESHASLSTNELVRESWEELVPPEFPKDWSYFQRTETIGTETVVLGISANKNLSPAEKREKLRDLAPSLKSELTTLSLERVSKILLVWCKSVGCQDPDASSEVFLKDREMILSMTDRIYSVLKPELDRMTLDSIRHSAIMNFIDSASLQNPLGANRVVLKLGREADTALALYLKFVIDPKNSQNPTTQHNRAERFVELLARVASGNSSNPLDMMTIMKLAIHAKGVKQEFSLAQLKATVHYFQQLRIWPHHLLNEIDMRFGRKPSIDCRN